MGQDPFGFGSLDDLYRSLSRQMQQGNPYEQQTPPTQFGDGGNGGQPSRRRWRWSRFT